MANERIGLTAVLELGSFSHAVQTYNQAISGMSKNTASTASSVSSSFVGVGSGILKVGAIAAGAGLAGIAALTGGLILLGSTALTEFAKYERMSLSIESLVARQLSQGQQVETQRTVAIGLTKKETEELGGLAEKIKEEELSRNTLKARIQEQSEALRQLREAHGADALDVQTATARLAEMEHQYQTSGSEIQQLIGRQAELSDGTQNYATVIEKVRTGQMSMTEAMAQAGPKAKELLGWISKLAINSPFSEEGVNQAFQTALAYGFTIDKAKELTAAELDFAAATGKGVEITNQIALALGQMQAKGKVSGQEIIQLTNAGVGVNKILEDMGFTLDDVSNGLVDSDKFIQAVIDDMNVFKGAGAAQANTFSGLISTLGDLKAIGLREFFTGTFTTIQPYLADFVGMLTSAALETGSIRALGDSFGTYVAAGLEKVVAVVSKLAGAFQNFGVRGVGVSLLGQLGLSPEAIGQVMGVTDQVVAAIGKIQGAFERFGLKGAGVSLLGQLGMDPETIGTINTVLGQIATAISGFVTQAMSFLGNLSFQEIIGGLTGIAAIVTTGILAALAAGLLSLLTPINLIIAGAALLGAAWAGNWGGIQEKTGAVVAYVTEQITALATVLTPAFNSIWDSITKVSAAFGAAGVDSSTLMTTLGAMGAFLVEVIIPAFVQFVGILAGTLAQAIAGIADGMIAGHNAFVTISGYITGTVIPAFLSMNDGISPVVDLLASLGDLINAVINKALQAMAGLWQNVLWPALQKVGQVLKDTLMPAFTSIGGTVKDDVSPALRDLGEVIFPLLQEGLDFVTQSIKDLIGYFNSLKDTVNSFSLPDVLTPGSPPPFANALTDIATSAGAAASAIAGMQRNLITSKSASLDFIDDLDMGGLAKGFGTGGGQWRNFRNILKNEIMGGMGALADGTADVMDSVYKVAARFNFPPQMAAEFAKANGLVEHLTSNFAAFKQQMNLENIGSMLGMGGSFSGIAGTLAAQLEEQMGSAEDATKALDALKDSGTKLDKSNLSLTDTLEDQQSKLTILQAELTELTGQEELDTIAIDKKKLAIEQLTEAMEENRQKIVDNRQALIANQQALLDMQMDLATGNQGDQIAFLQDFLDSGEDSIRLIGEELGGVFAGQGLTSDVYWTRVAAQERLAELLEEQRRQEELITQQKEAQGKLDKLKTQLDLINLGRQLGGDIFAGINFGLDASIEDLLAATNAVTMAMVDQINHDLQIHSPSGVMIKTFEQVMAGAALGVRRGESMLSDAVRSIPILNGSMPQFSQAAGISNSSTYNYNFPMTVNTAATAQGVVRQYDVRRSLANV